MSGEYENVSVANNQSEKINFDDVEIYFEELQMFDRSNLKGLNNRTENEIFYRFNSHEQFIKALQEIRYYIDEEFQTKDELIPVNIQNVYEILDSVMTEKQIAAI